ncbi:nucleotidyltransferase family protein [Vreelandella neptunia]|uniref:Nucleotidyltransferase family protein n=1 Tax=Vreelandella neptunia TaxID=115551 RepID=A0ABS9S795_9GAMM|nr:nucleotidyltransferase family protein [Halomonas neptunia]MCH4811993.1 nucleotidyltransferase family protein [Halomonas neptunia]
MLASNVVALVMAAGYSRRYGKDDKRCAKLADGRSLLAASVAKAEQAFPLLRVAVRAEDDAKLLGLAEHTPLIRLHQAHLGLGASLAEAVRALSHDAQLNSGEAVAILLGDMPWIKQETLLSLQRLATRDTILRPCHEGKPGHPVIFGRTLWPALETLTGRTGAKDIIRDNAAHYRTYAVQDAGTLIDIDTPAGLVVPEHTTPDEA